MCSKAKSGSLSRSAAFFAKPEISTVSRPTRFIGRGTVPSADAVVVEAHAPALVAGKLQQTSIGLFDEAEKSADETAERK